MHVCYLRINAKDTIHMAKPIPLMDNLESQTYETFEKDSVKYIQGTWKMSAYREIATVVTDSKAVPGHDKIAPEDQESEYSKFDSHYSSG
ncbi:Uncharacterized protein TCM_027766 [Theobroma cacao]|uniref:PRMT5 arginine-N-methyltransferase domain-containing protein n=1 Tax=Theobroma cacao TaxID=3641 RepID=A0A061GAW6_THECC|nr:Uncharacterized protein TCM_027766 [Theobroma cacao]